LGYQYEPEYTEEKLAAATATDEESTNKEEDEAIENSPLFSRNGESSAMWTGAELLFSLYFRNYTQTFFLLQD
jgi:hypothetical protein